jgi:hypothetical protein
MLPGSKFFDPSSMVDAAARYVEPALTVGTSLASEPIAGLYGLATMNPDNVEHLHHATTYQPRTESGSEGLAGLGSYLSGLGADIMDVPYLGQSIRNYSESTDKLGEYSPVMGAMLKTAPAFVASVFAPEAKGAFSAVGGDIGRTMASGGNMGRGGIMAGQRGMIDPAVIAEAVDPKRAARKAALQEKISSMPKQEAPGIPESQLTYSDNAAIDYRGVHKAPGESDSTTAAYDLSKLYPDDIYTSPKAHQFYGHGGNSSQLDRQTISILRNIKGKPDSDITIYRAVPKGVKDINQGDWVTVNRDYAKSHGESWVENGQYDIISKKVKAADIYTDGNSIHEFGYSPKNKKAADFGQGGYINPSVMIDPLRKLPHQAFRLSRASVGTLAGERAAQRVGSSLERTHKAYVAEKTATQNEKHEGRNLLAAH